MNLTAKFGFDRVAYTITIGFFTLVFASPFILVVISYSFGDLS
jgi:hypothetical protein